jgi:Protein kinase domain
MGVVYEATQLSLERTVALKVMAAELSGDAEFSERFRREGRVQARLEHPHILTVYEAGESDEGLFIAMRLVRGANLKDLIVGRQLDATRALTILTQVADALDTAHAAGLVHRDIKPQNVLVATGPARDHAYLADFGVTKAAGRTGLTRTGALVGTLDYMPPEQIEGHSATTKSDIYSFGAVLFESLTGVIPYAKNSDAAVLYAHLTEPPPKPSAERPELPEGLDAVLERAMAKRPEDRYVSATAMMIDVDAAFGGRAAAIAPAPGPIVKPEEVGVRRPEHAVSTPAHRAEPTTPAFPRIEPTTPAPARVEPTTPAYRVPAVATPVPEAPAVAVEPTGTRGRPPLSLVAAAAAALIGLAVAGFFGGQATGDGGGDGTATAGAAGIALSVPSGWSAARPRRIPGLSFDAQRIGLAPAASGSSGLVAGNVAVAYPSFLPPAFVSRLGSDPTSSRRVVTLAGRDAYRYRRLAPRGFDGVVTVYAVPRSANRAAVLACYGPRAASGSFAACDGTAATMKTPTALAIESPAGYASAIQSASSALARSRSSGLRRLRAAAKRPAQAAAAKALADAYGRAASRVAAATPAAIAKPAHRNLLAALRSATSAYEALRSAARRGNRAAYRRATSRIVGAESGVDRQLATLAMVVAVRR